jgi:anti-sigma-K factor RskA
MSGSTGYDEDDLLAAEYVLGTLEPADRDALSREAETNPAVRNAIETWERYLAPLNLLSEPVSPPGNLWLRIEAGALGGPAAARRVTAAAAVERGRAANNRQAQERIGLRRGIRLWRGAAVAGFALAAVVAGIALLRPAAPPPPGLMTALLPLSQHNPVFVAEAMADGSLLVRPVGALHIAPDRDLELWLLKDGETIPKPLGLLPVTGGQLAAGSLPRGGAKILVSLEPRGGSPTGLPTGPVLFGGAI